jgi:hypothetical protein
MKVGVNGNARVSRSKLPKGFGTYHISKIWPPALINKEE